MAKYLKYLIPLAVFVALVVFLGIGLTRDPREVPSPFIGKPAPAFTLGVLDKPNMTFSPDQMKGQVWLLNVWASWCESCRDEHPLLVEYSRESLVPLVGFNYKEVRGDGGLSINVNDLSPEAERALAWKRSDSWLAEHGNPYQLTVMDLDGSVGINYGVYGVPETFVIDKQGVIRYKQIGVITPDSWDNTILPLVKKLQQS